MGITSEQSPRREILIVDDDLDTRHVLKLALEMTLGRCEAEIRTAGNGREALDALATHVPSLVLLDLMMPSMSGAEFLRVIRKDARFRRLPVIVMSAGDARDVFGIEAQGFLPKPCGINGLLAAVGAHGFVPV